MPGGSYRTVDATRVALGVAGTVVFVGYVQSRWLLLGKRVECP